VGARSVATKVAGDVRAEKITNCRSTGNLDDGLLFLLISSHNGRFRTLPSPPDGSIVHLFTTET